MQVGNLCNSAMVTSLFQYEFWVFSVTLVNKINIIDIMQINFCVKNVQK